MRLHRHRQQPQHAPPARAAADHGQPALLGDRDARRRLPLRPRLHPRPRAARRRPAVAPSSTSSSRTRSSARSSSSPSRGTSARAATRSATSRRCGRSGTASTATRVRDFWRGEPADPGRVRLPPHRQLRPLRGRPAAGPYASINFVTAHDGFTLATSSPTTTSTTRPTARTTATARATTARGTAASRARPTTPRSSRCAARQRRNFLATLLLSQGVPMLLGGDELGRTQQRQQQRLLPGQRDLAGSTGSTTNEDLLEFTRRLIALRRDHPVFRRRRLFQGRPIRGADASRHRLVHARRQRDDRRRLGRGLRQVARRVPQRRGHPRPRPARRAGRRRQLPAAVQRPRRAARLHPAADALRRACGTWCSTPAEPLPSTTGRRGRVQGRATRVQVEARSVVVAARVHEQAPREPTPAARAPTGSSCTPAFGFDDAAARRRLPRRPRRQPRLLLAVPAGGAGQHPRLRRRRPRPGQRRARRRRGPRPLVRRLRRGTGWARCSTSCPTTWPSAAGEPRGGGTCSRTGRRSRYAALLRRRLGPARGASSATRCCCRSSATTTAGCSRRASSRSSREGGAFVVRYFDHALPGRAPRRSTTCSAAAGARVGSDELAFLADALRPPAAVDRRPTASSVARAPPRQGGAASAAWPSAVPSEPDVAAAVDDGRGRAQRRRRPRSTRCSSARTTGSPTGARRARSSTTAASSTSPPWSACASRTSRCSTTPTRSSCGWLREGVLDGLRIDHLDGLRDPEGYLAAAAERGARRRGSWSRRSSSRASGCPRTWPVDGHHRLRLPQPASAACSSTPRARRRSPSSTRDFTGEPTDYEAIVRENEASSCCARCWPPTSHRLTDAVRRRVRAPPALPRLHPPRAARRRCARCSSRFPVYRTYVRARREPRQPRPTSRTSPRPSSRGRAAPARPRRRAVRRSSRDVLLLARRRATPRRELVAALPAARPGR